MPILKSLFTNNNGQQPAAAPLETPPAKSRSPSVVARLMGLDMLPAPETALPKKQVQLQEANTLTDIAASGKKSYPPVDKLSRLTPQVKSFDAEKSSTHQDVKGPAQESEVRKASVGAECLQSIQLEELNKQLLAKHLQVLDELNQAKQLVTSTMVQQQRRGLSDSTEYMDALELLQVNRQFFEKYFRSKEVRNVITQQDQTKSEKASKTSYFRNGQSSPRPTGLSATEQKTLAETRPDKKQIVVLKPRSQLISRVRESATKEVLNKSRANTRELVSKALEKPATKDAKDIAKLIAKKIKEGIAKEVSKTFSSSPDSRHRGSADAVGEEAGPRARESSPRAHKVNSSESQSPRCKRPSSQKSHGESDSPRTRKPSKRPLAETTTTTSQKKERKKSESNQKKSGKNVDSAKGRSAAKSPETSPRVGSSPKPDGSPRLKAVSPKYGASSPRAASSSVLDRSPRVSPRYRNSPDNMARAISNGNGSSGKRSNSKSKTDSKRKQGRPSEVPKASEEKATDADPVEDYLEISLDELEGHHPVLEVLDIEDSFELDTNASVTDALTPINEDKVVKPITDHSPVSVLDTTVFDDADAEDVKEVISEHGVHTSTGSELKQNSELLTTLKAAKEILEASKWEKAKQEAKQDYREEELTKVEQQQGDKLAGLVEGLKCPLDRQEELQYLRDLLTVSDLKLDSKTIGLAFDPCIFEKVEDNYSQQQASEDALDRIKVHSRAVKRWLMFDLINEILASRTATNKMETAAGLLEDVWCSILEQCGGIENQQGVDFLVEAEMGSRIEWMRVSTVELSGEVEGEIFDGLLAEAIQDFAHYSH